MTPGWRSRAFWLSAAIPSDADLAENPERAGVGRRDDIPADLRLYPFRYSRNRVAPGQRVEDARHVIAFRFDDERVEILRLLHDAMDFPGRLG